MEIILQTENYYIIPSHFAWMYLIVSLFCFLENTLFARDFKCTPTKNLAMSIVMIGHYANRRVRKSCATIRVANCHLRKKNVLRIVYLRGGTTCKSHLRGGHN